MSDPGTHGSFNITTNGISAVAEGFESMNAFALPGYDEYGMVSMSFTLSLTTNVTTPPDSWNSLGLEQRLGIDKISQLTVTAQPVTEVVKCQV